MRKDRVYRVFRERGAPFLIYIQTLCGEKLIAPIEMRCSHSFLSAKRRTRPVINRLQLVENQKVSINDGHAI